MSEGRSRAAHDLAGAASPWLLRASPAWHRRERSLLEASPPDRRWPGSGWVWLLSMLWVGAGATYAGYFFYLTTKPWPGIDLGIVGWAEIPVTLQIVIAVATVVLYGALLPVLVAGFIRLRGWRPGNRRRAGVWAGAWSAGVALYLLAGYWETYPLHSCPYPPHTVVPPQCPYGSPAVVSWGELPICAAWLVLGILMTWILVVPATRRPDVPNTTGQAGDKA